jgi:CBS domain containing-hemolysin-like protein
VSAPNVDVIGRQPSFVDEDLPLSALLAEWPHEGGRMSIVRNADGRVVGLVTLSDVFDWLLEPITPPRVAQPSAAEVAP